jgi:hydroxymethylpyrimidine pyrophosphatase-like HAD family hydrolase
MTFLSTFDERRQLVVDLDGVLMNGGQQGRQQLQQSLETGRDSLVLVYVSGQSLSEQLDTINGNQLLLADYIVSSVGTEIHRMPGEHPLDEWYRYIQAGFSREEIVAFLFELLTEDMFGVAKDPRR